MSGTVGIMAAVLILLLYVFFLIENFLLLCRSCKNNGKAKRQPVGKLFLNISDHDRSLYSFTSLSRSYRCGQYQGLQPDG